MQRLAVVGCGRLAAALARSLPADGTEIVLAGFVGRRFEAAADFARRMGCGRALEAAEAAAAEILWFAVPDRELRAAAARLAAAGAGGPGLALHSAGAYGIEVLARLGERAKAVLHPPCALPPAGRPLAGLELVAFGEAAAADRCRVLARALGATLTWVEGLEPALYHAACALVANGGRLLLELGREWLAEASGGVLGGRTARALLASALEAAAAGAGPTGPAARGDLETLRRHLRALQRRPAIEGGLYRALLPALAELARRAGLDETRAAAVAALAEEEP